jgi:hypothetical protein
MLVNIERNNILYRNIDDKQVYLLITKGKIFNKEVDVVLFKSIKNINDGVQVLEKKKFEELFHVLREEEEILLESNENI